MASQKVGINAFQGVCYRCGKTGHKANQSIGRQTEKKLNQTYTSIIMENYRRQLLVQGGQQR
jgi:Zinc knuckle